MRNFEERKAEIFRRSENRIKERKEKRSRILAACIPLCLVLTVCSVTILPDLLPVGADMVTGENAAMQEYTGKTTISSVQIEVICKDSTEVNFSQQPYILTEDLERLWDVYYSMESALQAERGNEESKGQDGVAEDNLDIVEKPMLGGDHHYAYKITFHIEDGIEVVYTLDGYMLTNNAAGKRSTLTPSQRNALLQKLGLEETK